MKSMLIYFLVACSAILSSPALSWAQAQSALAAGSGAQPAPLADKAAPASPEEAAQLAQLGAKDPGLLAQSAGERVVVVERERGCCWGGGWWGPRRGPSIGAVILTVALVVLIVVAAQPTYYRR
jgi:hypothetical protein